MFRILTWCGAISLAAMTGFSSAQDLPQQTTPQVSEADAAARGVGNQIASGIMNVRGDDGVLRQGFVAVIGTWLSAQFALAAIERQPVIKLVPREEIVALRYNSILGPGRSAEDQNDTVAVYHDTTQTIYLAQDWTGSTPAEQSILVHEMVHHFQKMLGLKYECSQAREELAYRAQDRWLGLFGHDLATDFELDGFSLLVKTRCFY
jgi:uncharacterized protein DUF6647